MAISETLKARRTGVRFHGPVCPIGTTAEFFVNRETAGLEIITNLEGYVPVENELKAAISGAIAAIIQARGRAGLFALQCVTTLVSATNRARGDEAYRWRLSLGGMALVGVTAGAVLLGMAAAVLASIGWHRFSIRS